MLPDSSVFGKTKPVFSTTHWTFHFEKIYKMQYHFVEMLAQAHFSNEPGI